MNFSKIINLVWTLYFISLVFFGLFSALSQPNLPIQAFVIQSGSMEPTIMTGDLALIKTDFAQVQAGEVITFKNLEGTTVTHRIIEEVTTGPAKVFITQGDNNQAPDPDPVPEANIFGVWFFAIPRMGYVLVGLKTALGLSSLVAVPVVLLILTELTKKSQVKLVAKSQPLAKTQPLAKIQSQPATFSKKSDSEVATLAKLPTPQSVLAEASSIDPSKPQVPPAKVKISVESL